MALSRLNLVPQYAYKFNLYFNMCEKICFDCMSNRNVLGYYTEKAREWTIRENAKQFVQPPTAAELFHIWWKMAADIRGSDYCNRPGHEKQQSTALYYSYYGWGIQLGVWCW